MTQHRKQQIKNEAIRRLNCWLENSDFIEMTCDNSYLRFTMSLGLQHGYSFDKPKWMAGKKFVKFIKENEGDETDEIISELFYFAQSNYYTNLKTKK